MKLAKRLTAAVIVLVCAIVTPFSADCVSPDTLSGVQSAIEGIISYKSSTYDAVSNEDFLNHLSEKAGSYSADWYYIALSLYGVDCRNAKSIAALKSAVDEIYEQDLSKVKVTDMQRISLALLACGCDVTNVNGHKLLADCTYNRAKYKPLDSQGVNSAAYALLLLDSNNFSVPKNAENSREDIINLILSKELENGGFSLFGNAADIDITTIVVQALAPYKNRKDVSNVLDKCVGILSKRQTDDGGYKSFANLSCAESTAQVVLALVSMGIDPMNDSRFIKNGNSVLDGLMRFRLSSGGFSHFADGVDDNMATYQSLCALVACYRYLSGEKSFYDFDVEIPDNTEEVSKTISKTHTSNPSKPKSVNSSEATDNNSKIENKSSKTSSSVHAVLETASPKNVKNTSSKTNSKTEEKTKATKSAVPSETSAETTVTATADEVFTFEKDIKISPETAKGNFVYIDFALIFAGYIALFIVKIKGGKR